jgi:hypothetical protein
MDGRLRSIVDYNLPQKFSIKILCALSNKRFVVGSRKQTVNCLGHHVIRKYRAIRPKRR